MGDTRVLAVNVPACSYGFYLQLPFGVAPPKASTSPLKTGYTLCTSNIFKIYYIIYV